MSRKKKARYRVPFKNLSPLSQKHIVAYTKQRMDKKEPKDAFRAYRWEQMKPFKPTHVFVSQKKPLGR